MVQVATLVPVVGLAVEELQRHESNAGGLIEDDVCVLVVVSGPLSIENKVEEEWSGFSLIPLVDLLAPAPP